MLFRAALVAVLAGCAGGFFSSPVVRRAVSSLTARNKRPESKRGGGNSWTSSTNPVDEWEGGYLGNNEWTVDRTDKERPVDKDEIAEKVAEVPASRLLIKDVTAWGMKTALAEEHLSLGNYAEGDRLAVSLPGARPCHRGTHPHPLLFLFLRQAEAMRIADHVSQPDSVYHAFAQVY